MYYVVRRAFRGYKGPMTVGSVIEPTDLRDFKYRLREKHIIEVNEHNFEHYQSFFKERYGVDIPAINVEALKAKEDAKKLAAEEAEKLAAEEAERLAAEEAEKLAAEEAEKAAEASIKAAMDAETTKVAKVAAAAK